MKSFVKSFILFGLVSTSCSSANIRSTVESDLNKNIVASCTMSVPANDGYSAKVTFFESEIVVSQQSRSARFAQLRYDILDEVNSITSDMDPLFSCSKSLGSPNYDTVGLTVYDGYASLIRSSKNARIAPIYYRIAEQSPAQR